MAECQGSVVGVSPRWLAGSVLCAVSLLFSLAASGAEPPSSALFAEKVAPLFEKRCLSCHNSEVKKGGLSLATAEEALAGGETGQVIFPGDADSSVLLELVSGDRPAMPKNAPPLSAEEVQLIRRWILEGANWPNGKTLANRNLPDLDWWSFKRIDKPALPFSEDWAPGSVRTPIDRFILARLAEKGLRMSPEADRRTLLRRLTFDLWGLPPDPQEVQRFESDSDPLAYERLVDRLLSSPRYGERWARHWLDVVHYGDTHGFDKDKVRPNSWPYRDYVIRSLNEDKPYSRFVREQLAGDVLYPDSPDAIVATGFIAAGPWDFVGHVELREGTLDKQITRNLDRDDMVASAMNTFVSLTAQCARCHNHKFDPITQEDYYSLQAVFAAMDRADRPYDPDPQVLRRRRELAAREAEARARRDQLHAQAMQAAGEEVASLDVQIRDLQSRLVKLASGESSPSNGYHSAIESRADVVKWVQIDLGESKPIDRLRLFPARPTDFPDSPGFGFPARYRVALASDAQFSADVFTAVDQTAADGSNPGDQPLSIEVGGRQARYVRVQAEKLWPRSNDFVFALAELEVWSGEKNLAAGAQVESLDSIEAGRWSTRFLVDGYTSRQPIHGSSTSAERQQVESQLAELSARRESLFNSRVDESLRRAIGESEAAAAEAAAELASLPAPSFVFAAASQFAPQGNFTPTGGSPRPIYILARGSEKSPGAEVGPGTVSCLPELALRFEGLQEKPEGARRAALADWIVDRNNPLTWRSIVNRVWHYHFGRGLVDSPNDFGRMGALPTHPELLDWLAAAFRDGDVEAGVSPESLKSLHRLIVTSAAYRQSCSGDPDCEAIDAGNQFLWRMNRRKLEAEAIRDAVLAVAGKLNLTMYGPAFREFGFQDDHSPHYLYEEHNPDDAATHRRSIYRFLVRSAPDPFMESLDCADPSMLVEKRNETLTAMQALTLLNDKFMVRMAEHFASRVAGEKEGLSEQLASAWLAALGRQPSSEELVLLTQYAQRHGLANACRLLINMNEFVFVD